MGMGRNWHRTSSAAGLIAALVTTSGCRWIPLRHPDPAKTSPATSETSKADTADALPPLPELRSINDAEAFQAPPTPLLDAAAERDKAIKRVLSATHVAPPQLRPAPEVAAVEKVDPDVKPASLVLEPDPPVEVASATPPLDVEEPPKDEVVAEPQPLPVMDSSTDASLWKTVLSALATPVDLPAIAPLRISTLKMCKKVHGFGNTEPLPSVNLKPGQEVLLYCEIDGLQDEETAGGVRSRIATKVAIVSATDQHEIAKVDLGEQNDVCAHRRRDFFANYRVKIPANAPAGTYEIRVLMTDLLAKRETSNTLEIKIVP